MAYDKRLRVALITAANNAVGDNVIVPANQLGTSVGSIKVYQVDLNSTGANTITFKSGATVIGGQMIHTTNGSATVLQDVNTPWAETKPGQPLVMNFTAGTTTTGTIYYALA